MATATRAQSPEVGSVPVPPATDAPDDEATGPVAATEEVGAEARAAGRLVALLALTVPIAWVTVGWAAPGDELEWTRRVSLAPFDLVLIAALAWAATHRAAVAALARRRSVRLAAAAQATVTVAALLAHPSWLGVDLVLRLAAGLAVIAAIGVATTTADGRRRVLGVLAGVGVVQAVLAMAQSRHGTAFGIELVDFAGPLYPFGDSRAGRGGLGHPYHLAVLLIVAQGAALLGARHARGLRSTVPWLGALVVLGAGLGVTYSRSALIGQVGLVAVLLLGRTDRRTLRLAAVAVAVGLAVGAAGFGDGWVAKAEQSSGADPASDRGTRVSEALDLIGDHPVLGVGPGRYVTALAETNRDEYLPAHNLLLHEAAELGLIGALTTGGLCLLLAALALRGGTWPTALVVPMLPFLGLDAYPYVFGTGLALSALWLGLVRLAMRPVDPVDPFDGVGAGLTDAAALVIP